MKGDALRVILFSTAPPISYSAFCEVTRGLANLQIAGVIVHEKKSLPDWDPRRTGFRTWTREQLMAVTAHAERTPFHDRYEEILASLLADPRSFYLMERWCGTGLSRSVFNSTLRIDQLVWNSLAILFQTKPDRIVSGSTPHDTTWFFARIAEMLGVKCYAIATSPLPWKRWIVRGLDEQVPLEIATDHVPEAESSTQSIRAFIEKGRSSYELAMPEYERERLRRYKGGFFRPAVEIQSIFASPSPKSILRRAYITLKKRALLKTYASCSRNYVAPAKYIVFFLHYQPERTTLPEGNKYVQQWLVIRSLAAALPADWSLVVKEHPSTYRNRFHPSVRDPQFYEAIHKLPNARLAPLDVPAFELIDKSRAVATVTGTVGVESLIRGKPVLVFGAAQYRNAKGVFTIATIDDIGFAIRRLANEQVMPNDCELLEYFSWVERHSFPSPDSGSNDALRAAFQQCNATSEDSLEMGCTPRLMQISEAQQA